MRLTDLLADIVPEGGDARVTGFAIDNRKVAPGTIFGAFKGSRFNGEDFIAQAIADGAVAIVSAPGVSVTGALHLTDAAPRRLFAQLAEMRHGVSPIAQ